jgi:hypothetical protein
MSHAIPKEKFSREVFKVGGTRLILQEEVIFEKGEVRRNSEENLAKMDENNNLKNGVRVKVDNLNLIVIKESTEEIADQETEPALEEGGEHHNFNCVGCRDILAGGRALLQHHTVWEKMAHNKLAYLIFISGRWLEQVWM